jgi:hypothetical protein
LFSDQDSHRAILFLQGIEWSNPKKTGSNQMQDIVDALRAPSIRCLRTRLGAPKAIVAMAHQLARIIWILISRQLPFDPSLFAYQEKLQAQRR